MPALIAVLLLVGCASPRSAYDVPVNIGSAMPKIHEPNKQPNATDSSTPVGSDSPDEDEDLIRSFQRLAEEEVPQARLERFVVAHPQLLRATAKPYGPALLWVLEFEREEAALVLIRAGASVDASKPGEAGPLHLAARGGLDKTAVELLTRGASPTAKSYWGTPLHFAAAQGHVSTMRLLIDAGADPTAHAPDHQFTPLHKAVIERHVEAVQLLIDAKADLEARDDDGRTPLHWGGFAYVPQPIHEYFGGPHDTTFEDPGPAKAMVLLLDAGARIDAIDKDGNTPLHAAVEVGSRRGVELLVARGAKRTVKNHAGKTPLDLARDRRDESVLRLLR